MNRKLAPVLIVAAPALLIAMYLAGYVLCCHASYCEPAQERIREYRWKWQCTIFAPAAKVEAAALGINVRLLDDGSIPVFPSRDE